MLVFTLPFFCRPRTEFETARLFLSHLGLMGIEGVQVRWYVWEEGVCVCVCVCVLCVLGVWVVLVCICAGVCLGDWELCT